MGDDFSELLELARQDRESLEYKLERSILDITEQVFDRMKALGLNKAQLAERLGVSRPFVTKMLNGNTNFTLKSLVGLAEALECELSVGLPPRGGERRAVSHPRANADKKRSSRRLAC